MTPFESPARCGEEMALVERSNATADTWLIFMTIIASSRPTLKSERISSLPSAFSVPGDFLALFIMASMSAFETPAVFRARMTLVERSNATADTWLIFMTIIASSRPTLKSERISSLPSAFSVPGDLLALFIMASMIAFETPAVFRARMTLVERSNATADTWLIFMTIIASSRPTLKSERISSLPSAFSVPGDLLALFIMASMIAFETPAVFRARMTLVERSNATADTWLIFMTIIASSRPTLKSERISSLPSAFSVPGDLLALFIMASMIAFETPAVFRARMTLVERSNATADTWLIFMTIIASSRPTLKSERISSLPSAFSVPGDLLALFIMASMIAFETPAVFRARMTLVERSNATADTWLIFMTIIASSRPTLKSERISSLPSAFSVPGDLLALFIMASMIAFETPAVFRARMTLVERSNATADTWLIFMTIIASSRPTLKSERISSLPSAFSVPGDLLALFIMASMIAFETPAVFRARMTLVERSNATADTWLIFMTIIASSRPTLKSERISSLPSAFSVPGDLLALFIMASMIAFETPAVFRARMTLVERSNATADTWLIFMTIIASSRPTLKSERISSLPSAFSVPGDLLALFIMASMIAFETPAVFRARMTLVERSNATADTWLIFMTIIASSRPTLKSERISSLPSAFSVPGDLLALFIMASMIAFETPAVFRARMTLVERSNATADTWLIFMTIIASSRPTLKSERISSLPSAFSVPGDLLALFIMASMIAFETPAVFRARMTLVERSNATADTWLIFMTIIASSRPTLKSERISSLPSAFSVPGDLLALFIMASMIAFETPAGCRARMTLVERSNATADTWLIFMTIIASSRPTLKSERISSLPSAFSVPGDLLALFIMASMIAFETPAGCRARMTLVERSNATADTWLIFMTIIASSRPTLKSERISSLPSAFSVPGDLLALFIMASMIAFETPAVFRARMTLVETSNATADTWLIFMTIIASSRPTLK